MATRPKHTSAAPLLSGVSAESVRGFLLQAAELGSWSSADLQKNLGIDASTARGVVTALQMTGYVESDGKNANRWRNTEAGNAMAGVSRARPITRKTAEKALEELKKRIDEVNREPRFLYAVDKAVIFGPYLTSADKLKNIDVAIALRPKVRDQAELERKVMADAETAAAKGKRFKSFADRRHWGVEKVRQHLKQRTRAIAIYDLDDVVTAQPRRTIFQR